MQHSADIVKQVTSLSCTRNGIVRRDQVLELGGTRAWIRWQERSGWLNQLHPGVYLVGSAQPTRFAKWTAAVDAAGRGGMLLGVNGAVCAGLMPSHRATFHDEVFAPTHRRDRSGIAFKRVSWIRPEDVVVNNGVPCARDAILITWLARDLPIPQLIRVLDQAEFMNHSIVSDVRAILSRSRSIPGRRTLLEALDKFSRGDHGVASGFEFDIDTELDALGAPPALTNPVIALPDGDHRPDRFWPDARLVVEADWTQHGTERNRSIDLGRDARTRLAGLDVIRIPSRLPKGQRRKLLLEVARRASERRSGPPITIVTPGGRRKRRSSPGGR